jgi:hypothetical protein
MGGIANSGWGARMPTQHHCGRRDIPLLKRSATRHDGFNQYLFRTASRNCTASKRPIGRIPASDSAGKRLTNISCRQPRFAYSVSLSMKCHLIRSRALQTGALCRFPYPMCAGYGSVQVKPAYDCDRPGRGYQKTSSYS